MTKRHWLVWAGLFCLLFVFAIDFHFDIRQRDAFSWMDPQQYYGFAVSLVEGTRPYNDFEVASIFPFSCIQRWRLKIRLPQRFGRILFLL